MALPHAGKKVCVVLSGCGVYDGSEIQEAVIALLALSRAGATAVCAAPDKAQMHVIDHSTGQVSAEARNVRAEAARIARGDVRPLAEVRVEDFDALFFPGGYGAAKNLSTFAVDGAGAQVDPEVARVIHAFHDAGKPIGAVCISPCVVAATLRTGTYTIGSDAGTASAIEAMGGQHQVAPVDEAVVDRRNRVVTAPAYMESAPLRDIATGIEKAVAATLELVA
jgi:enhancing lycopene biosynthesis protein 2